MPNLNPSTKNYLALKRQMLKEVDFWQGEHAALAKLLRERIEYIARDINYECGNSEGTPCDDTRPRYTCKGHKWLKKARRLL
jgi:hypothetical protein